MRIRDEGECRLRVCRLNAASRDDQPDREDGADAPGQRHDPHSTPDIEGGGRLERTALEAQASQ